MELARLTDLHQIEDLIVRMFVAADQHNWDNVSDAFTDTIKIDYSSLNGSPTSTVTKGDLVKSWEQFLPKFTSTHHQLGNFQVMINDDDEAEVNCYVIASHFYQNDSGKNIWTVVGSYSIRVVKQHTDWKIHQMKLNLKYQDGNTDLPKIVSQ